MNVLAIAPFSAMAGFASGVALNLFNSIPWVAIFLLTQLFGVRLYVLNDKEMCQRIQKRLTRSSHVTDGGRGYGISVGRWYYASVTVDRSDSGDTYGVWMIATAATFTRLTAEATGFPSSVSASASAGTGEGETKPPAKKTLTLFERTGSYSSVWWRSRRITVDAVVPRPEQMTIIEAIEEQHRRVGHTVALLHGPPGTGKSMLGILLASRLDGCYCNTLRPWQAGDSLAGLYAEVEPTAQKPLILVFEEIDGALLAIHAGVPPHKSIPITVADKAGWNRFLDEIGRGMYPHLILLLTTNRSPEFIRSMDPSYIRDGRVDFITLVAGS